MNFFLKMVLHAINLACGKGHIEVVRLLILLKTIMRFGIWAIQQACEKGNIEVVWFLFTPPKRYLKKKQYAD